MNQFEKLRSQVNKELGSDISQQELGTANGFFDLEEPKQALLDLAKRLLDRLEAIAGDIEPMFLERLLAELTNPLSVIQTMRGEIERLVKGGVNEARYPPGREALIQKAIKQIRDAHTKLREPEQYIAVHEVKAALGESGLPALQAEAASKQEEAAMVLADVSRVLDNLREKASEKAVATGTSGFEVLANRHRRFQVGWFISFVGFALAALGAVLASVIVPFPPGEWQEVTGALFRRVLGISVLGVAVKVCLAKFNVERHLKITYDHRGTVLEQFRTFEAAIGDTDPAAKNALRLEIAKYIFADPQTGLADKGQAEFNVAPVINLMERATGRET